MIKGSPSKVKSSGAVAPKTNGEKNPLIHGSETNVEKKHKS